MPAPAAWRGSLAYMRAVRVIQVCAGYSVTPQGVVLCCHWLGCRSQLCLPVDALAGA